MYLIEVTFLQTLGWEEIQPFVSQVVESVHTDHWWHLERRATQLPVASTQPEGAGWEEKEVEGEPDFLSLSLSLSFSLSPPLSLSIVSAFIPPYPSLFLPLPFFSLFPITCIFNSQKQSEIWPHYRFPVPSSAARQVPSCSSASLALLTCPASCSCPQCRDGVPCPSESFPPSLPSAGPMTGRWEQPQVILSGNFEREKHVNQQCTGFTICRKLSKEKTFADQYKVRISWRKLLQNVKLIIYM